MQPDEKYNPIYYPQSPMGTKSVSSRLARKKQKSLKRQTWLLVFFTIILLVLFIFVIVPNVIRIAGNVIDGGGGFEPEDTIPPQVPVIAAPVPATPSAQLRLTGYAEPESELVLVLNGSEYGRETVGEEGDFETEVGLREGENAIKAYSIDKAGNESSTSKEYRVALDTKDPTIILDNLEDGASIELRRNQTQEIKGVTEPGAQVTVNGRRAFTDAEGAFSIRYQLEEGENTLLFEATDRAGNTGTLEITVGFRL